MSGAYNKNEQKLTGFVKAEVMVFWFAFVTHLCLNEAQRLYLTFLIHQMFNNHVPAVSGNRDSK